MNFHIETLGCKVNQYETQAIERILTERGHCSVAGGEPCDVFIINTCAVTAESGRKSRQAVRRARADNPHAVIGVCGCYSQISPDEAESLDADLVSGSGDRMKFIDALLEVCETKKRAAILDDPMKRRIFEPLPSGSVAGRTRAMLKIQDGCSNFCTYCIIPYARGPVRSLPMAQIAEESKALFEHGYREIVVTGIEISSYGKDLKTVSLIDALECIAENAPGVRIHLGSLEPRTVTREFAERAVKIRNLCDHFHLSLQSGCDETLARMRRKYGTARFYESCEILREYFPGCGITTDLITGFPGETEEEFSKTMQFIEKCAFSDMHIFPYSVRPGTPAEKMPDQVRNAVKKSRAAEATRLSRQMSSDFREKLVGKTLSVLFETENDGISTGHSGNYIEVSVYGTGLHNEVRDVLIESYKNGAVFGKCI